MEELYFNEILDQMQDVYSNIFLLAIKKQLNLGEIVETVTQNIEEYKEQVEGFVPQGKDGLLFVASVAKMMDYSIFDVIYLNNKEKNRIIQQIIDEIDFSDISDYSLEEDDSYFIYDYVIESDNDIEVDFEFKFIYEDEDIAVRVGIYIDGEYGFESDMIPDSVEIWRGTKGEICRFVVETIEDLWESEEKIKNDKTTINYKDFFIHSNKKACNHEYIKVMATVPIFSNWEVRTITFEADYCAECGIYYIPEYVYQNEILMSGRLLCQVMSYDEYSDYKKEMSYNGELKPQSILNMIGYNVNAKDNLSEYERRTILRYAIESGIITKKLAIFYLQTFIKKGSSKKGLENAVSKWKSDLQWLYDFEKKGDIIYGVRRLICPEKEDLFKGPFDISNDLPFK